MTNHTISGPNPPILVCVDSWRSGTPSGWLFSRKHRQGAPYASLSQLLGLMQQSLDQPSTNQAPLTSFPPRRSPDFFARRGARGTFSIQVILQENDTWQGWATWLETGLGASFQSELELLFLLDNALSPAEQSPAV